MLSITFCLRRFKSDEERTPVYRIVDETFPHLLNIFSRLVQIVNPSLEIADLIKLICKIFWSSIYVRFFSLHVFRKRRNLLSMLCCRSNLVHDCMLLLSTLSVEFTIIYYYYYYYYLMCIMCSFCTEVELMLLFSTD
jgi:hypothetical protein